MGTHSHFPGLCVPCECRRALVSPCPLPLEGCAPSSSFAVPKLPADGPIPWSPAWGNAKPSSSMSRDWLPHRLFRAPCHPYIQSGPLCPSESSSFSFCPNALSDWAPALSPGVRLCWRPLLYLFPQTPPRCTHSAANPLQINPFRTFLPNWSVFLFG